VILVDTSVWVDHLKRGDAGLARHLEAGVVLTHAFVIGEIACGLPPRRAQTLSLMKALKAAPVAEHLEVLEFIERHRLSGRGIGYVDVHLLASAALADARLWTRDKRLSAVATEMGLADARGGDVMEPMATYAFRLKRVRQGVSLGGLKSGDLIREGRR